MAVVIQSPTSNDASMLDEWHVPNFCQFGAPPPGPPPPGPVTLQPLTDTIRGGKEVTFFNGGPLVGTTELLKGVALPAGWISALAGSARFLFAPQGILATTGTTNNSEAKITIPTSFRHFDLAIDVDLELKFSVPVLSYQEICTMTFTASNATTQLSLVANRNLSMTNAVVSLTNTRSGVIISGGQIALPAFPRALRLIKYASYFWAYIGTRTGTYLDKWTDLQLVGSFRGLNESGLITIATRNHLSGTGIQARLSNFTSRAHAVIDGQLVNDKEIVSPSRMRITVPATTLEAVGTRDSFMFGQGVGVGGLAQSSFIYTLPAPLTVGQKAISKMRFYDDPALKDQ